MKNILKVVLLSFIALVAVSCTKYNFEDTGVANGKHYTTMWDYFATDGYNWDSLRVMAQRANLVSIFQGTSEYGKDITFFGITNHSIRAYLYANELKSVSDLSVEQCRTFILNSIITKRIMLDDFTRGVRSSNPDSPIGTGGEMFTMASGKKMWIYSFQEAYDGVPSAGPVQLYIVSGETTRTSHVASSNIETLTGVVHSLDYNFRPNDF